MGASSVSDLDLQTLAKRVQELEALVSVISRGKYAWESTFDAIRLPVHIVSKDFDIRRANTSVARVGGGDIKAYIGKKCYDVFAGRKEPCEGCPLEEVLRTDQPVTCALKTSLRDREYEVTAYPYHDRHDDTPSAILSYRDVTEELQLQQEVMQQEKLAAIGVLAGGVAHEINNPLGGILAFLQLLIRDADKKKDAALKEDLQEIERAALRCKRIVADLLDFSRTSREKDRRPVDVRGLLEKILPFVQSEIKASHIDLQLNATSDIPSVFCHPDRLQQVFLNLLTNACHAMPKGGALTLELKKNEHQGLTAMIKDTGIGISREQLPKIFDPFFTTKEPGKGTGLGLSISYRIVKELGGTIEVESRQGQGTVFTLNFPKSEE